MPRFLVTFASGDKVIVEASSKEDARTLVAMRKARIAAGSGATKEQKDEFLKRSRIRNVQQEKK